MDKPLPGMMSEFDTFQKQISVFRRAERVDVPVLAVDGDEVDFCGGVDPMGNFVWKRFAHRQNVHIFEDTKKGD